MNRNKTNTINNVQRNDGANNFICSLSCLLIWSEHLFASLMCALCAHSHVGIDCMKSIKGWDRKREEMRVNGALSHVHNQLVSFPFCIGDAGAREFVCVCVCVRHKSFSFGRNKSQYNARWKMMLRSIGSAETCERWRRRRLVYFCAVKLVRIQRMLSRMSRSNRRKSNRTHNTHCVHTHMHIWKNLCLHLTISCCFLLFERVIPFTHSLFNTINVSEDD